MLLQRHYSRVCRKKHNALAQRVFKTAPLYAVTNPEPTATPDVLALFTTFFESLWSPATNPDGTTVQKAGMSYVYDEDGTLIADTLTGGASTSWGQSARYIYLPTASGPMPIAAIYGTKHYAIQSDHLHTPRRLIQSDGQVAWQWAYSAFGDEQPTVAKNRFANVALNQSFGTTTVAAVTFNLRYPGQYFDQESNLHYNLNRSLDAKTGRYTQSDPIGLRGGWNRFSYVEGNPLSNTDPLGLAVEWTGGVKTFGATAGVGGQLIRFELESQCMCGKKVKIKRFASFITLGAGLSLKGVGSFLKEASGSSSGVTLTDSIASCPDASAANGIAWTSGVGVVVGAGGTFLPALRLGRLKMSGLLDGPAYGFDVSLTSTFFGQSVVTSTETTACCD
jgi:RHS repeat-associated protein